MVASTWNVSKFSVLLELRNALFAHNLLNVKTPIACLAVDVEYVSNLRCLSLSHLRAKISQPILPNHKADAQRLSALAARPWL